MKKPVAVITGSTKGIGFGMAEAFLKRDCRVVVSGRDSARLEEATAALSALTSPGQVVGQACDVGDPDQIQALWDTATRQFDTVDIWINNAGLNSIEQDFWEHDPEAIQSLMQTNLLGTMYGCRVAARGMIAQGHGRIYALEGWGSSNERRRGSTLYGTSKAAIRYFARSLQAELRRTPVQFGTINPGLVATDLLALSMRGDREANAKRFVNLFGDRVETAAPELVNRVLADRRHGSRIVWLTPQRVLGRLLAAPFRKRRILD
ncbi:short-chain dehydrogenase of unknown substrate specificity [Thioflavicoccus mobilis 8321]|uniref:Short-chain alcohol dehydrogenase n=1 Tax=Thioflavicoccus mobilis 8321 TaxID=765912 RepID=L0H1H7_9GAMM|nr:SDR family oxidoreductase [Thioflavicoccus mobilis]AGA91907.1 short-chain dehydrogenase of unknown substrate specificity [Thioflavicoccus mobilis 8321]